MPTKKAAPADSTIQVQEVSQGEVTARIIGQTPLIYNAMSSKAKRTLLMPPPKKTGAAKAANLKHDPVQEYRDSVYRHNHDGRPTRLYMPSVAFKRAMAEACLDLNSDVKKSVVGRLCYTVGDRVDIYGTPQMLLSVVRCKDINRTPDIRSRAILAEWACEITVRFAQPNLSHHAVANLLSSAGQICGVGDFRQQKGAGNYGLFRLVDANDPDWTRIVEQQGRVAQDDGLAEPTYYDAETEELFVWYAQEVEARFGKERLTR